MQIIKIGMLLMSLLAWPASAAIRNVDQSEFPPFVLAREQALIHRDNCIVLFMKYFNSARPKLDIKSEKLFSLAEALCENQGIFNNYLALHTGFVSSNPLNNTPVMLQIRQSDVSGHEWLAILAALKHSIFNDPHDPRILRGINVNIHQPYQFSGNSRYAITVHIDDWIDKHQERSPGKLLKWLDLILARRDTRIAVVAISKYDAKHYAAQGNEEVAEFLGHFERVRLIAHKDRCVQDLELPQ